MKKKYIERCSYCGGNKIRIDIIDSNIIGSEISPLTIKNHATGDIRDLCTKCLIKVFDKVLGKPNEKKT
jgi:hypothetical protein